MQEKGVDTPAKLFIRIYDTQCKLLSSLSIKESKQLSDFWQIDLVFVESSVWEA